MRMSVSINDELVAEAKKLTNINETSDLIRYAIKKMAAYEAASYLSTLGGSQPGIKMTPRCRIEMRKN